MSIPDKRQVEGVLVKLLHTRRTDRGMTLAPYESRCVRTGELHELVTTDQSAAACGDRIDRVGFLGFVEITRSGVVEAGDAVVHKGQVLGLVLGFDECHYPNHYNILIATARTLTADDTGLCVEAQIIFRDGKIEEET
jgi:hypothetical protein